MRAFVYSNIFVALCAVAMTVTTQLSEALPISWSVLALVFTSTIAVYNLDRLLGSSLEDALARSRRHQWVREHRKGLWALTVLSGLSSFGLLFVLDPLILAGVLPLALISAAYMVPVRGKRLKNVPGMKTGFIAGVWALVTAGLPLLVAGYGLIDALFEWVVLERFLFIFAITVPFEIRDVESDRESEIVSIVHLLGIRGSKALAVVFLAAFTVSTVLRFGPAAPWLAVAFGVSVVTTSPLIAHSHPDRSDYFYSVVMDGTMLVQAGLVALAI